MAEEFAIPLDLCCDFELHLRKVFRVDERLSWTLGVVDSRVAGDMLRVPFPAFALVFTDRHALGLAERLVSRMSDDARWRGVLRVLTVYVIEFPRSTRGASRPPAVGGWRRRPISCFWFRPMPL